MDHPPFGLMRLVAREQNAGLPQRPTRAMIIGQAPLPSSPRPLALGQPCFRRKVIKVRAFVSSGRPGEITTAKDVEVQVEDVLAGAVAVVHDQPEVVADPALPRD